MKTQTNAMQESNQAVAEENAAPSALTTRGLINAVKRRTRKRFSAEEKIRIVLEGFSRELPVSDLCRKENISTALYYSWLKDFMEAGKSRLTGDATRDATSKEVSELRRENSHLKEILAETTLEKELLKKSLKA